MYVLASTGPAPFAWERMYVLRCRVGERFRFVGSSLLPLVIGRILRRVSRRNENLFDRLKLLGCERLRHAGRTSLQKPGNELLAP
jgi:hypothetical protein